MLFQKSWSIFVVLIAIQVVCVVSEDPPGEENLTEEQWKQKADDAFKMKMFDLATSHYGKAIELDPQNYLYYYQRALVYTFRGRPQLAIKDFDSVLELNPTHITSLEKRSRLYLSLGLVDHVEKDIQTVKKLRKTSPAIDEIENQLHSLQGALKQVETAKVSGDEEFLISSWDTVLQIASGSEHYLLARAKCLLDIGRYERALMDAVHALRMNSKSMEAFWVQGQASFYMRDFTAAVDAYKRALKFDPESTRFSKAIKLAKKVSKALDQFNEEFEHKQWSKALDSFAELNSLFPAIEKDLNILTKKCQAYVETRKYKEAIDTCTQVIDAEENSFEALLWRGEAHLMQDEFQEARNDFQKSRQIHPDNRIMEALQRLERKEKMALRKDYYKILGIPRNAEASVIKKAYRKLAMEFHPDKHAKEEDKQAAEVKFLEITEAYEVLNDEESRSRYDRGEDINPPKMQQQHNPFAGGFPFKFTFH